MNWNGINKMDLADELRQLKERHPQHCTGLEDEVINGADLKMVSVNWQRCSRYSGSRARWMRQAGGDLPVSRVSDVKACGAKRSTRFLAALKPATALQQRSGCP